MRAHRISVLAGLAGATLILSGCGNGADAESGGEDTAETTTLRIAHLAIEEGAYEDALQAMNEELAERTDGRVEIETYPNGQLGGELEMIEQIQSGSIEGAALTAGSLSSVVPVIGGMELPYLFEDQDHARRAVDGEVGEFLSEQLAESGLVALGFWEMGYKNITNSVRPIASAEDAEGLQIRVLENPILIDTYSALGMDPTPLPWTETYTALQQGVVDAYEGPYEAMVSGGIHEVQDYVSEVQMIYGGVVLTLSQEALEGLSEEDQQTLLEIGAEFAPEQRSYNEQYLASFKEEAVEYGVEVLEAEDIDLDSFRAAVEHLREDMDEYSELVELADATR